MAYVKLISALFDKLWKSLFYAIGVNYNFAKSGKN